MFGLDRIVRNTLAFQVLVQALMLLTFPSISEAVVSLPPSYTDADADVTQLLADIKSAIGHSLLTENIRILKTSVGQSNFDVRAYQLYTIDAGHWRGVDFVFYTDAIYNDIKAKFKGNDYKMVWSGLISHELGHLIMGHHTINTSIYVPFTRTEVLLNQELQADFFTGRVFSKLSSQPSDLELSLKYILSIYKNSATTATPTHPAYVDRVSALLKGYRASGGKNAPSSRDLDILERAQENSVNN